MAQGLRDMLANRKFAIPLIILLAFCFIGLLLIGIILILKPGAPSDDTPVAQTTPTSAPTATDSVPATLAPVATETATPKPTPTLVPVGTSVSSAGEPTATGEAGGSSETGGPAGTEVSSSGEGSATVEATGTGGREATATTESASSEGTEATATTEPGDEELAQTGVGWGLILASGAGLAALALAARRLRMTI